jgi:hypothetical protein
MGLRTYQLTVIGTIVASFLVGLHMPAMHEIIEHGATARWDIVAVTAVLAVATVAGGWMLLRAGGSLSRGT